MRNEIKERKRINRLQRNETNVQLKEQYGKQYKMQKEKVKSIVREEMFKYEDRKTTEIRDKKNGNNKMWENIKELRGIESKRDRELKVYNNEGKELTGIEKEKEIREFWEGIFRKHKNRIEEIWDVGERTRHRENIDSIRNRNVELIRYKVDNRIREHIDGVMRVEGRNGELIGTVEREIRTQGDIVGIQRVRDKYREIVTRDHRIEEKEVKETLKKVKGKKSAGLDGLKPELYKELGNSRDCVKALTVGYNRILDEGGEPSSWGSSRTAMLGKNSKPRVEQIRLITMTEVGYKIFMSILGDKMDRH